ncbi:MAG: flagellar biosynthesis protein FlhF [Candidatus Hydrogenedentota bacterium]
MPKANEPLHTFRAASLDAAYHAMKETLGKDAIVVRTAEVPSKGLGGWLGRKEVEVTARVPLPSREEKPRPRSQAEQRYQQNSKIGSDETVNETVEYFRQLVSDAQHRIATSEDKGAPETPAGAPPSQTPRSTGSEAPAPVIPFRKPAAKQSDTDKLEKELQEMREMLQVLLTESRASTLPPELARAYQLLLEQGVTRKVAASVVGALTKNLDEQSWRDERILCERLKVEIRKRTLVTGGLSITAGKRRVVALVGATGVGKTTNLAKLAALFAVRDRGRVALVTTDTYRFGAPEQLRVYANIIGVPLKVVNDAGELIDAMRAFRDYDLVLIDTAGGSQFNVQQIQEQRELLHAAAVDEAHLVMSANTRIDELHSVVANLRSLNPAALMFTKLDETRSFGPMFSLGQEVQLPISYLSMGQNVPDDILLAQPAAMANLVMEGKDDRGRPSRTFA